MDGTLRLHRCPGYYRDQFRRYVVRVDGKKVGTVATGEEAVFSIAPGRHHVRLRCDWGFSNPLDVDIEEGRTTRIGCHPDTSLLLLVVMTIYANQAIKLFPADDEHDCGS